MSDPELDPGPNPRECGALLSEGDPRDRLYAAATAPREEIPRLLDLTPRQSAVMNQQGGGADLRSLRAVWDSGISRLLLSN